MDQRQHRNYPMSGQFTFLGRYRPHSLQMVEMDQHQHRNSTSEHFTFVGRHQPDSLQVVIMDQHQRRNYATSEQFTFFGRNFNPENLSLAQARGNLMRGDVHSHYHSNPGSLSNVHHAANFISELPCLGQTSSGPLSVAPRHFAGYDSGTDGIDTSTVSGRFPLKRKSPDVPMVYDQGNSNLSPFEGSSSMPGLLDRQFDDNQNISRYSTSFQQYSRGNDPNILNDSGRNVRSRSGPNLVPTPITSQHVYGTNVPENHSVATNNLHTNSNASAAWNFNFASSHVPGRTVSETNGVSREANQFLVRRHGVEAGQYSYNSITGRNDVPPAQYVEVCENNIRPQTNPSEAWGSTSLSYRQQTRNVGNGYEATSNYHLHLPAETYSFRYSWPPSRQMWCTSYQNGRARGAIDRYSSHATIDRNDRASWNGFRAGYRFRARYGYESTSLDYRLHFPAEVYSSRYSSSYTTSTGPTTHHSGRDRSSHESFLSHEPEMNRNGSMETQHVIQDDLLTYFPRPRDTNATQDDLFTYLSRPRDTDVIHDDLFTYIPRLRDRDDMFIYFPRPRHTYGVQDDRFTYFPRPRDVSATQDDMFTFFPRPRDGDAYDQYEDMRLDIDNMSYEELLALEEHIGNMPTGLTEGEISNCLVESWSYASEENKDESICPICLDESNTDRVTKLRSCGHEFHLECITKWLEMKNVCPMCKRSVA